MERPEGIVDFTPSPDHFPFTSRWFDSRVGPVHYVDEGEGRPVLMLHGNPEWSFVYRHMIEALRDRFRCIAVDYPGFGLSGHPDDYGYTPAEHSGIVGDLVDHLELADIVVVGGDWGGPIGLDVASRRADRVGGLLMANTWYWPADGVASPAFSLVMGSPPVQWLIEQRNFFVTFVMRRSIRVPIDDEAFAHYTDVVPTPAHRAGIAEFPKQIRTARPWMALLEERVRTALAGVPVALVWGMKDPAFGSMRVVDRWMRDFPQATVLLMSEAGHFIQEDAGEVLAETVAERFGEA
jgi:haloalkane dehalogenase